MKPSEVMLLLSGIEILGSIAILFATGSFVTWVAAKVLYGIGVVLFLANR